MLENKSVEECLERVNKQKALIDQIHEEEKIFREMYIGKKNLIAYMDWERMVTREKDLLARYRAELSAARGE